MTRRKGYIGAGTMFCHRGEGGAVLTGGWEGLTGSFFAFSAGVYQREENNVGKEVCLLYQPTVQFGDKRHTNTN